jgi:hypothetical protein
MDCAAAAPLNAVAAAKLAAATSALLFFMESLPYKFSTWLAAHPPGSRHGCVEFNVSKGNYNGVATDRRAYFRNPAARQLSSCGIATI